MNGIFKRIMGFPQNKKEVLAIALDNNFANIRTSDCINSRICNSTLYIYLILNASDEI